MARSRPALVAAGRPLHGRVVAAAAAAAEADRWAAKRKQLVVEELAAASRRLKAPVAEEVLRQGVEQLESIIPGGFQISMEAMKAVDWLKLVLDPNAAAVKLVVLKSEFPRADLAKILRERPSVLLLDVPTIESNARQVHQMLEGARDRDALLSALPLLLEPRTLASVLVTVDKWYFGQQDPIAVLENDPEMLIRAMACDIPLEPVFNNADGSLMIPKFNYREKRADWQAVLDKQQPRQHWGAPVKSLLEEK